MQPYTFKYRGIGSVRQVVDLTKAPQLMGEYQRRGFDYIIINPPMTPVEIGGMSQGAMRPGAMRPRMTESSNYLPSMTLTLENITIMNHNSLPSIERWSADIFRCDQEEAVREYLRGRGWWCGPHIPQSPFEIAEVERIIRFGTPLWEKKLQDMARANCTMANIDYYL